MNFNEVTVIGLTAVNFMSSKTGEVDYLERFLFEMTCYMSSLKLSATHTNTTVEVLLYLVA